MDVWSFLGGLTMGAAAAAIYDMSSGPKLMGDGQNKDTGKEGIMFSGTFRSNLPIRGVSPAQPRQGQPAVLPQGNNYARSTPPQMAGRKVGFLGEVNLAPVRMGQNGAPSNGGAPAAPAAPAGQPSGTSFSRQFGPMNGFGFPVVSYPTFPGYVSPPAPSGKLTCRTLVNEDTGEETLECEPKPEVAVTTYRYPTVYMNPMFF